MFSCSAARFLPTVMLVQMCLVSLLLFTYAGLTNAEMLANNRSPMRSMDGTLEEMVDSKVAGAMEISNAVDSTTDKVSVIKAECNDTNVTVREEQPIVWKAHG
jgi:hypothetical protein